MGEGQQVPKRASLFDQELPVTQVQWVSVCQSATQIVALKNQTSRNPSK
jgi:hypothetical protein